MRIRVVGEREIVVAPAAGLEIEQEGEAHFGPLHMLAGSLGTCTVAVLASWAGAVGVPVDDLELTVRWEYVEEPYRVGSYESVVRWPSLPAEKVERAARVAETCTVHRTLEHPPATTTRFER